MKRLLLLRGVPASGKTTFAKEEEKNNGAIRFNKDDIRIEFRNREVSSQYTGEEFEKIVYETERSRVEEAMKRSAEYIIVDNTHLGNYNKHIKFYKSLADKYEYEIEIKDFYISKEDAILRDTERDLKGEASVGPAVIEKMFKIAGNDGYPFQKNPEIKNTSLPSAVIFDVDSTLSFKYEYRDIYDGSLSYLDDVNQAALEALLAHKTMGKTILIVTGRKSEHLECTKNWLDIKNIPYDEIYCRKEGDERRDDIVKKEIYNENILGRYNVSCVYDDRDRVVKMWRMELGLPCFQVYYGNF